MVGGEGKSGRKEVGERGKVRYGGRGYLRGSDV